MRGIPAGSSTSLGGVTSWRAGEELEQERKGEKAKDRQVERERERTTKRERESMRKREGKRE